MPKSSAADTHEPGLPVWKILFFLTLLCLAPSAWAQNSAPIGVQDLYVVEVNQTLTVSEDAGLLSNDYDLDGDLDLFICDDTIGNRLYQNDGGQLVDVAPALGLNWRPDAETTPGLPATEDVGSMMPHFVDLENDGDRDLFLTVWNRPAIRQFRMQANCGD